MLINLSIKNLALVEDALLEFGEGLNALTGETGAGKTIVLDALGLLLGDKAGAHMVRQGAARLTVAGGFRPFPRLKSLLKSLELDADEDEMLVRREVDAAGKSKAFVNDSPVNLATLSKIGELLVHAHGQHEHQILLKAAEQRDLVDAFGALEREREAVARAFAAWREIVAEKEALTLSEQERAQRLDLYRFQRDELKAADPKLNEEEELERLLPQLKNAEKLQSLAGEAAADLSNGDGAALDKLKKSQKAVEALQSLGADVKDAPELLLQAVVNAEEAAAHVEAVLSNVDLDPARLDEILSRMDLLAKLRKKYGPTLADVVATRTRVEAELDRLENLEGKSQDLQARLDAAAASLARASDALTKARAAAAKKLSAAVLKEFSECGLPHADFDASVEKNADGSFTGAGQDLVQFLFTPNPGEGKKPLAAIASGGELSRVMLALKSVLAKTDPVPTLVFDEIDAGVGGTLGGVLGKKLAKLGKTHQVLCITHLATIAACAAHHFRVEKEVRKDRTRTAVVKLTDDERVPEIARMVGADPAKAGGAGLQHARELLTASKG